MGYGVKVVTKDGKLVRVEGDDDNPITRGRVNAMNLALREFTYAPERIIHPMKRAREDRGLDKWVQTTWDEALDTICEKVRYFQNTYGPQSIVVFGGTGREACIYYYALTFSVLQSPNCCYTQSGWSCYGPRCSIADYVLGAGYPEARLCGAFAGQLRRRALRRAEVDRGLGQGASAFQWRRLLRALPRRPHEARLADHLHRPPHHMGGRA